MTKTMTMMTAVIKKQRIKS